MTFTTVTTHPGAYLPHVGILATGGTIAGVAPSATGGRYEAARVGADALMSAVPQLHGLARISAEQVAAVGSQDMTEAIWLALARRVNGLLARADVDGVVITHGTDSMEETAYFLHLVVKSRKPVVLVGAMRPSNALGADGPLNLFNALAVAAHAQSHGRGVMVVMNDAVLDAREATKAMTTEVQAFAAPHWGPLGRVRQGIVCFERSPQRVHTAQTEFDLAALEALPQVGIVYSHVGASALPVQALADAGYAGIVSAGFGNGNMPGQVLEALARAAQDGVAVVRSSRVGMGATTQDAEVDDAKNRFIAAGMLNPQKARVLLQLALTRTKDTAEIQRMFDTY